MSRVHQLLLRLILFLTTLFLVWSATYWTARALIGSGNGYWHQFLVSVVTLVVSLALFALRDFKLIRRAPVTEKHLLVFQGLRLKIAVGITAVLALFLVSWSFVYLVFSHFDAFHRPQSGYWSQLSAFLLCFFVAYGIILPIGWLTGSRLKEFTGVLNDAVNRIAHGDFTVNLPLVTENSHTHFDNLIEGVNKMTESLQVMETMRREFVANVSHEIQTPLTNIAGYAEALRDNDLSPASRQQYLDIVQDEAQRLSRLAEHLLRLSSLDAEARTLQPERYRLDAQIREVVLLLEAQWTAKDLNLVVELSPITVLADRELLSQVWFNLFQNAIKFTPQGGQIKVRAAITKTVEVCFSDTGEGIDPADLPRVFDRFFKASPSRSRALGGNGLGLAIVQKIVELHAGSVQVSSAGKSQGSEFVVVLPGV